MKECLLARAVENGGDDNDNEVMAVVGCWRFWIRSVEPVVVVN